MNTYQTVQPLLTNIWAIQLNIRFQYPNWIKVTWKINVQLLLKACILCIHSSCDRDVKSSTWEKKISDLTAKNVQILGTYNYQLKCYNLPTRFSFPLKHAPISWPIQSYFANSLHWLFTMYTSLWMFESSPIWKQKILYVFIIYSYASATHCLKKMFFFYIIVLLHLFMHISV